MKKHNESKKVFVEVAKTPDRLAKGLMFRDKLEDDSGMLFVFEKSMPLSFWGMNTFIPLDIAFIDDSGVIKDVKRINKMDLNSVKSSCPCKYALEVQDGWFKNNGFGVGDYVERFLGEIDGHIVLIKNKSSVKTAQIIGQDEKDDLDKKELNTQAPVSLKQNQPYKDLEQDAKVVIPKFSNVFAAIRWSMANLEVMRITYRTINGHIVTKDIEPHKVFFSRSGKRQVLKAYDETSDRPSQYVVMNISSYGFPGRKFTPKSILLNRRIQ
jgi:uncharacterized membrane protein (UPF0127 family)